MEVYADYTNWPAFIPTIKAVRLMRRDGPKPILAIDHAAVPSVPCPAPARPAAGDAVHAL